MSLPNSSAPVKVMSLADLAAFVKDLNLGPTKDSGDTNPSLIKNDRAKAPDRTSKLREDRRSVDSVDESSAIAPQPQSKLHVESPILSAAQGGKLGAPPTSPCLNKKNRLPRYRKKRSNERNFQIASSALPAKEQEITADTAAKKSYESISVYVVEAALRDAGGVFEMIIGVFTSLSKANKFATEYAGVSDIDIIDIVSSFGNDQAKLANAKVTRMVWPNGMSEFRPRFSSPLEWIKVLPKEFAASVDGENVGVGTKTAFLALDRSRGALFVIGAYKSKGGAWEACKKYRTQLSYCNVIENSEPWFDKQGMFHIKGAVGGRMHHWFVEPYALDLVVN